jgi:hypothetical protein
LRGLKLDEVVEIISIFEIGVYDKRDRVMVLKTMKGEEEKRKATELRNITMTLVFFMIEHQFCSTIGKDGKKTVWRQVVGISIGSSCSGILANLTLLMGEMDMLDRLETKGIF